MRAGQDAQGTIGIIGGIEVESNGEHLLEKLDRRLDVRNAVLDAPRAETGNLGAGAERQRQILMPRNQPIGIRGLVEVNGTNRKRLGRHMRTNEIEKLWRTSQLGDRGYSEKPAPPRAGNRAERGKQHPPLIGSDSTRDDRKSVLLDSVVHRGHAKRLTFKH